MDTPTNSPDEQWLNEILQEATATVAETRARVVVYNDDHNTAELVHALLSEVATDGDEMLAQHLMLNIHYQGRAIIFEGTTVEADQVAHRMTQGGFDRPWCDAVVATVPQIRGTIASLRMMQRELLNGGMPADAETLPVDFSRMPDELRTISEEILLKGIDVDDAVFSWIRTREELYRPQMKVTVINDEIEIPQEWPGTAILT